ncbi:MAG: hypothetical protein PUG66_02310 [Clostridiales bacterium]|nr:hypothetical protein [Clostridiales bacterium]
MLKEEKVAPSMCGKVPLQCERKLRPDGRKKQVLAVKTEGARWDLSSAPPIREKITARLEKKARIGRKN